MRPNTRSLPYFGWDGAVERPPFPLTPDEWAAQNWFSTPPFKWQFHAPESCLWSVTKRMFAMTNKTLRNTLTALAAFAIAVNFCHCLELHQPIRPPESDPRNHRP